MLFDLERIPDALARGRGPGGGDRVVRRPARRPTAFHGGARRDARPGRGGLRRLHRDAGRHGRPGAGPVGQRGRVAGAARGGPAAAGRRPRGDEPAPRAAATCRTPCRCGGATPRRRSCSSPCRASSVRKGIAYLRPPRGRGGRRPAARPGTSSTSCPGSRAPPCFPRSGKPPRAPSSSAFPGLRLRTPSGRGAAERAGRLCAGRAGVRAGSPAAGVPWDRIRGTLDAWAARSGRGRLPGRRSRRRFRDCTAPPRSRSCPAARTGTSSGSSLRLEPPAEPEETIALLARKWGRSPTTSCASSGEDAAKGRGWGDIGAAVRKAVARFARENPTGPSGPLPDPVPGASRGDVERLVARERRARGRSAPGGGSTGWRSRSSSRPPPSRVSRARRPAGPRAGGGGARDRLQVSPTRSGGT